MPAAGRYGKLGSVAGGRLQRLVQCIGTVIQGMAIPVRDGASVQLLLSTAEIAKTRERD
jgi:hypothetical protein